MPVRNAFLWMSGTIVCFSTVAVAARELSFQIDIPSIVFLRSIAAIIISVALVAFSKEGFAQVHTTKIRLHVIRNCLHFVGQYGWVYAVAVLPLAQVFAIEFTVPLWLALLAPIFLSEKLTVPRILSIVIGFVGVLIAVRPFGLEFHHGSIVMLVGAIGFATAMLGTRKLIRTETPLCILLYMSLLQLPLSTLMLMTTGELQIPNITGLLLAVFITAGVMFAHVCMMKAFQIADVLTVAPMDYLRLPLITVVGALLYAEAINLPIVLGGALILAGNYMNLRYSTRQIARPVQ